MKFYAAFVKSACALSQHWSDVGISPAVGLPDSVHCLSPKLQALVYDILPSTTAVFSYAIGPRKLSANEQFFVGAQTVVN